MNDLKHFFTEIFEMWLIILKVVIMILPFAILFAVLASYWVNEIVKVLK